MSYKVTFTRHGGREELVFHCREDAEMFANWLEYGSAGIDSEVTEVPSLVAPDNGQPYETPDGPPVREG